MNKAAGWIAGLVVLLGLSALALRFYVPPLPPSLDLQLVLAAKPANESEPLVVTGEPGHGDFLYVKRAGATTIVFGYDRWGSGGPLGAPVRFRAGQRHSLRIESPSLARVRGSPAAGPEKLRVVFDGAVVLEAPAAFELRGPKQAWFAENPLGGSSCGPALSGELLRADGRALRGRVRQALSPGDRVAGWLTTGRWQVAGVLLAAGAAGWLAAGIVRTGPAGVKKLVEAHRLGPHRWFITAAAPCLVVFCWFITAGTGDFAVHEPFSEFYDYQAASLLQGRLDVPKDAISGEAFVVAGKYYGYFGLTPAVLRLPFVVFDVAFASLSRGLMTGCYLACLVAAYALLRRAVRRSGAPGGLPSAFATVLFTIAVGLGTPLLFLGTRAYVYHEAIMCGAAFALWSAWAALRWLDAPDSRWWLGALGCGVLAMHARPTSGLFALTLLGCVAIAVAWERRVFRGPLLAAGLATVGLLSFSAVSYLKFGTFDGSPFKYSVQYDARRLARFDGKNFHLSNLRFNTETYFLRANFKLHRNFPWLEVTRPRRLDYPRAKLDHVEHTLGIPYAMPALFALATAGSLLAALRAAALRRELAVLWLGVAPMAAAMLTIVVVSHRYSTDFCPFLICAGASGLASVEMLPDRWRRASRLGLALLTAAAIAAGTLIALRYQGAVVWGVPDSVRQNYQQLARRVDAFFGVEPPPPPPPP